MKSLVFTSSFLYHLVYAQSPLGVLPGSLLTCRDGYTPSLTCDQPLPVSDECSCACRDGLVFNQTRPSGLPTPTTPGLDDGSKIEDTPCTREIIQPWTQISLPHKANTLESTDIGSHIIDIPEESILLVADSRQRCQHFEVYINDRLAGETYGEGALDNAWCGKGEECMEKHGGSHGFFRLSKGQHKIGLRWVKVTPACQHWSEGVGEFQIYKPC